ncbi:ATP-binding protein [Curtobacterium pusillum]|uniref:ATP-binding protein n=1 Tax=Curtobacterium pusillum TaxID=69373 RepID=UPI00382D877E
MAITKAEAELAEQLRGGVPAEEALTDSLKTNDRVIARVTDGIYRQPGSAIRELIANAFDADAKNVIVSTDVPRFGRISVEDDGQGMTPEAVVHLLHNIGGSLKRTGDGEELGVTSTGDRTLSPRGRRLIGKLGIGLFSVSQLTHSFQIVTKCAGDDFRTVAAVWLRQFSDEPTADADGEFTAGDFELWTEPASNVDGHGTTILLDSIRPQAKRTLQSDQLWRNLETAIAESGTLATDMVVPAFYMGRVDSDDESLRSDLSVKPRKLPWSDGASPSDAFAQMVESVWGFAERQPQNARLAAVFDSYLQMVWNLGLSLPLPYVHRSPFELNLGADRKYFRLSNQARGSATPVEVNAEAKASSLLPSPVVDSVEDFRVVVDGIELSRPLIFENLPSTAHVMKDPLFFIGHLREEFIGFSDDFAAGPLEFDAYMVWTPKVAPTEHQGVLVRINGSSGTLFDPTFFGYQVSEITRLRQVTCEIFVREGLEAALNIDRESFNSAHPHAVVLTSWVHSALRQLATTQKREASLLRRERRKSESDSARAFYDAVVERANDLAADGAAEPIGVSFDQSDGTGFSEAPDRRSIALESSKLNVSFPVSADPSRKPSAAHLERVSALIQVLSVHGLLDGVSERDIELLAGAFLAILEGPSER